MADDAAVYPEVVIVGTKCAFDMPATVESGGTRITLDNRGPMDHHAMPMRVNDGWTLQSSIPESLAAPFDELLDGSLTPYL